MRQVWAKFKLDISIWRLSMLPGIAAITFVFLLRMVGSLQFFEWTAFDTFLHWRRDEPMDDRILIVGINEKDIERIKNYPIPDKDIAALLNKLQNYQPAVIGLDIFRSFPEEPGHAEFVKVLKTSPNLIGVEKVLPDTSGLTVKPPPNLPQERVGFADALLDADAKQRRSLLGTSSEPEKIWRLSFPLLLAKAYLKTKNIALENIKGDPYGMKFGSTNLTRFQANSGGYVNGNAGGSQILINFRSNPKPFYTVSLEEIQTGKVPSSKIRDKIVLIGITSSSIKDYTTSSAIKTENAGLIYGVEIQAHVVSQIISATLNQRVMINVWADVWEYLWIAAWGIFGIVLGRRIRSPLNVIIFAISASIFLILLCYILLFFGWWVPVVPAFMTLFLNSAVLASFYRYDDALRSRIQDRQQVIDQTFSAIHSRPLQTLSMMLREVTSQQNLVPQQFVAQLKQLNQEIHSVHDLVRKEALTEINYFYLQQEYKLDLQQPLHELLHEVYEDVLERDYPNLKSSSILKIITFNPMDERNLSIENKRSICRFLEEALCNVGKYANGMTKLEVICKQCKNKNIIKVADNGLGFEAIAHLSSHSGFGTRQAQNIAKQLGGKFERLSNSPGVICQLTWSSQKIWFW